MTTEERFSELRFPIHTIPVNEDLAQALPRLFVYKEFKKFRHENKSEIIRYICFLYDPGSDIIEDFPQDLEQRRIAAAIEAGIERNNFDKFPKWFNLVMNFQKEKIIKIKLENPKEGEPTHRDKKEIVPDTALLMMILRFIRIFKNRIWTEICTLEVELDRFTQQRWEGMGVKDPQTAIKSSELSKICDSHIARLNSLYGEFFGDKDLEKEVVEMITPENRDRLMSA